MNHSFNLNPLKNKLMRSGRIDPFSDGIFAIAVTLLVLNLHVPRITETESGQLWPEFEKLLPSLFSFLLGFILICSFWVSHHIFYDLVVKTDLTMIWLNVFTLMGISFLPFPVAILGAYPHEPEGVVILGVSHIITGLIFCLMIWYAIRKKGIISDDVEISSIQKILKMALLGICTFTIPIAVAFVNTMLASVIYFVIAFSYIFLVRMVKLKNTEGEELEPQ